jgi:hypothetical protein
VWGVVLRVGFGALTARLGPPPRRARLTSRRTWRKIGTRDRHRVLSATLCDTSGKSFGPGRIVAWSSSSSSVASVTPLAGSYSATVKGKKGGSAINKATSEG